MNRSTQLKQATTLHIQQLCPLECSVAFCLNQLRSAKIQFLNLGNLVICPKQNCLMIFKSKMLIAIESMINTTALIEKSYVQISHDHVNFKLK